MPRCSHRRAVRVEDRRPGASGHGRPGLLDVVPEEGRYAEPGVACALFGAWAAARGAAKL
jgi:hypothetical protein